MNKKSCCGCFGCGCFVVAVAFLIGGYMGVDFLHGKGVEFAASGLTHTLCVTLPIFWQPPAIAISTSAFARVVVQLVSLDA